MVFRNSSSGAILSLDNSAMDLDDRGQSSRLQSKLLAPTPPRLHPSDSSMLDLTVPFTHATSLVRRVFSEALLLLRLAVRLWSYLGVGYKWAIQLLRLCLYAVLLLPGFIQMIFFYYFNPRVRRSVIYGPKPRQRLDLYFPLTADPRGTYPVVIYVTGGAWTIGYKAWGALLARRLSEQGVLVACLDYRNFPQGDALDMLEDVNTGIAWVLSRIHRYDGDPDSVTLVGQSAGGHLACQAVIKQAEQAALGCPALGAYPSWSPTCLRAFVGVSGAYDLAALAEHLHRRGLYKNLFERIMSLTTDNGNGNGNGNGVGGGCHSRHASSVSTGNSSDCSGGLSSSSDCNNNDYSVGDADFDNGGSDVVAVVHGSSNGNRFYDSVHAVLRRVGTSHDASGCKGGARPAYDELSPLEAARRLPGPAAAQLPYMLLIHGTADKTVPSEGSANLAKALRSAGVSRCRCVLVPGKTHTAFLLEDPMRGGRDLLMETVLSAVVVNNGSTNGNNTTNSGTTATMLDTGAVVTTVAAIKGESHVYRTLCPGFLCDLAGWVCPF